MTVSFWFTCRPRATVCLVPTTTRFPRGRPTGRRPAQAEPWRDLDTVLATLEDQKCTIVGADRTEYDPDVEGRNRPTGRGIVAALIRLVTVVERQIPGG